MNIFIKHIQQYDFFKSASQLAKQLNFKVYVVGGYVRDLILEREQTEIDFLIVGDGLLFANEFAKTLNVKNVTIYKTFGTAHFKFREFDFEFVGSRKESYNKDSRNPVVKAGTFDEDINRRDFTINSLAISLNENQYGELIDKFNGLEDINNKLIKTPLDPQITFNDDPLRILRAFRFASQLDFNVDNTIKVAAADLKKRLEIISQERITQEFLKILSSQKPSIGLNLMYETKIMSIVFPEVSNMGGVEQRKEHHHKDVFLHTCQVVDNIATSTEDVWLRFAALVHDIAKPRTKRFVEEVGWIFHGHEEIGARMMESIFKKLKLPLTKLEYVEKLVKLHLRPIALVDEEVTDSAIRRFIVGAGESMEDLITLCRADITSKNPKKVNKYLNNYEKVMQKVRDVKERDKLREFQSPVRVETIMEVCKIAPSKMVVLIKSAIEEAILDGKIGNNYEEAYEYMLKIKDDFIK